MMDKTERPLPIPVTMENLWLHCGHGTRRHYTDEGRCLPMRRLTAAEFDRLAREWLREKFGDTGVVVDTESLDLSLGDLRAAFDLIETLLDVAPDIERPTVRVLDRCAAVVARILVATSDEGQRTHDGPVNVWSVLAALDGAPE